MSKTVKCPAASLATFQAAAHLFCHDGKPVDGRSALLHEGKQLVKELLPLWVVVNLVKLGDSGVLSGRLVKVCLFCFGKSDKERKGGEDKARINYFLRGSVRQIFACCCSVVWREGLAGSQGHIVWGCQASLTAGPNGCTLYPLLIDPPTTLPCPTPLEAKEEEEEAALGCKIMTGRGSARVVAGRDGAVRDD